MPDRPAATRLVRGSRLLSRRAVLGGAAFGALTGLLGGCGWSESGPEQARPADPVTVDKWLAQRGQRYYIAHRGSGDVYPEHSLPAYQAALGWRAACMEVSVGITSDGVLCCMHDATYDRTTNIRGSLIDQPSSVLAAARVWQPRLGRAWTRNAPAVPLLEDVLATLGHRTVLALEAKADEAYEPMMAMVEERGLTDAVIVKAYYTSARLDQARQAGYPRFAYFGAAAEVTASAIQQVASTLDPARDGLALPGYDGDPTVYLSDDLVTAAVATGVPIWMHPLHRRCDARHFFDLGAAGAICSSYGYISGAVDAVSADSWSGEAIASGEMTRDPASDSYALEFTDSGELRLPVQDIPHFVTVGQCTPAAGALPARYTVDVEVAWPEMPGDPGDALSIVFGREDDSYYQHKLGLGDGYHALLRATGTIALFRHRDGVVEGEELAAPVGSPPPVAGQWVPLRVSVAPDAISIERVDTGAIVTAADAELRGGYVHLGRTSKDGVAAFRGLRIG